MGYNEFLLIFLSFFFFLRFFCDCDSGLLFRCEEEDGIRGLVRHWAGDGTRGRGEGTRRR